MVDKPWLQLSEPLAPVEGEAPVVPEPAPTPAPAKPWLQQSTPAASAAPAAEEKPGFLTRVKRAYTGEGRLDPAYADRPEFGDAFRAEAGERDPAGLDRIRNAIGLAQVAPTEKGQLSILQSRIPGLEVGRDKFDQVILRAPGMTDYAYLNKPGFTAQDVGEFGMQTIPTLPMGLMGLGRNFLTRVGLGAMGGAGGSVARDVAAEAAGSGEGVSGTRAAVSGAIGAAVPGVVEPALVGAGRALGAMAGYPLGRIRAAMNPDGAARRDVAAAIGADRRTPRGVPLSDREVRDAASRGQDVRVLDLGGESTRALARSAANQSPEARAALLNLTDNRLEGQSGRLETFIRDLVARPGQTGGPNAYATSEALQVAARNARRPHYDRAYQNGAAGLASPMMTRLQNAPALEGAMRAATTTMQNRAAAGTTTGMRGPQGYTLEFWDMVKRNLDDTISSLKKSGAKSAAMDIDNLRRPLVAELDRMVPAYANARGTAATFFRADDALEAGQNFVSGKFNEHAARAALAKMTPQERDLFAEGFATRFIENVRKVGDRRSLLNAINNSPSARERFNIALGPNRSRAMEAFLRVEGIMDLARNAIGGNSTTARQLVELGLIGGYGAYANDPYGALLAAGLRYGNKAVNARVSDRVAQMLLSNNIDDLMRGVRQVGSTPMMESLRNFDRFLTRMGITSTAGQEAAESAAPAAAPVTPAAAPSAPPAPPSPAPAPSPRRPEPIPAPSVTDVPKQRGASLQGREEAQRMAQEAIANGAPADAVNRRLAAYLKANNLEEAAA